MRYILVVTLMALLLSCKPAQDLSKTKTLDNFAAGKTIADNQCKGTKSVVFPSSRIFVKDKPCTGKNAQDKLCQSVKSYLTAVPEEVQSAFASLGGSIIVRSDAAKICSQPFSDKKSGQFINNDEAKLIKSCFFYGNAKNAVKGQEAVLSIIHDADSKEIAFGGVRVFGYLFSQFLSRLDPVAKTNRSTPSFELMGSDTMQFSSLKNKVAHSFVNDVLTKKIYQLETLSPLLGDKENSVKAIAKIKENHSISKANIFEGVSFAKDSDVDVFGVKNVDQAREIRRIRFEDYIFAEAFDSFHCSDATRKVMNQQFADTEIVFTPANNAILALAKSIAASNTPSTKLSTEEVAPEQTDSLSVISVNAESAMNVVGGAEILALLKSLWPAFSGGVLSGGFGKSMVRANKVNNGADEGLFSSLADSLMSSCKGCGCNSICKGGCSGGCCCGSGGCQGCSGGCSCCPSAMAG
jgi:hypothetical protein